MAWTCLVLIPLFFEKIQTQRLNFCNLPNGDKGRCIEVENCPKGGLFVENCGELVCCRAMERIVTPNVTPPYVILTPGPPVYTPSGVTFATAPPTAAPIVNVPIVSNNMANSKCQEYKHRVQKRSSIVTYVFGGTQSLGKEFPHMAALGYNQIQNPDWLCGGSLISEQFVVTAAHCLISANVGELVRVRLGDLDLRSNTDDANPQDFGVIRRIPHPNYHPPVQYNDIALVQLDRPVQFNEYIAPICLEINRNLPSTNFIATGWGITEIGGPQSDVLMKVDLDYFPSNVCQQSYNNIENSAEVLPQGIVDNLQICAGSHTDDRDTCQGDSGGPLQIREDVFYMIGVTSFGRDCGIPNVPAVYTRVSSFVPWIESVVWPN